MAELTKDELQSRADRAINHAKAIGMARRQEIDRAVGYIELALYQAENAETIDALVGVARDILLPERR